MRAYESGAPNSTFLDLCRCSRHSCRHIFVVHRYELSFKVWQCGGVVEWVPCSHVAHAYRGPRNHPSHVPGTSPYQTSINHLRLAHVWMDDYVEYYYRRDPAIRTLNYGDITERKQLRERLKCKSFKWFMETIAYDVLEKFPPPSKNLVWGEVNDIDRFQSTYELICSKQNIYRFQCQNSQHSICLNDLGASFGQAIGVATCFRQVSCEQ
jgi:hypothetical protein